MGKLLGLALLASAAAVGGTVHFAAREPVAPLEARSRLEPAEPRTAAAAGEECPHTEEVRLLLYHLRYGSNLKRREVAIALARLGLEARSAIPELVEFLTHVKNWWGRAHREIVDALLALGVDVIPLLEGRLTCKPAREQAAWTLARLGPAGLDALVRAVGHEGVPLKVLKLPFVHLGKGAAAPLAALLRAAERHTRERAAWLLLRIGKNARPVAGEVVQALQNREFGDRMSLVRLLPSLRDVPEEAIRALAVMLKELPLDENGRAVQAIWRTGRRMGDLTLKERQFVSGGRYELTPLHVLGKLGTSAHAVLPALERVIAGADPVAAAYAARAHWQITGEPEVALAYLMPALAEDTGEVWCPALNVLDEMGAGAKAAIPVLVREMDEGNALRRHRASSALAKMGDDALPAVRAWLATTGDPGVGVVFFHEFQGRLGEAALDRLSEYWDEDLRAAVTILNAPAPEILALGVDEDDPVPELRRMMRDPKTEDPDLVGFALRRLGRAASPAVPELIEWLRDEKRRDLAADVLAAIGPGAARAIPALERHEKYEALWRITGETRYRDLAFRPEDVGENDVWALPRLIEVLNGGGIAWRRDAARALGRLGAQARSALPDLARVANDETEDEYLRDHSRAAIDKIERG